VRLELAAVGSSGGDTRPPNSESRGEFVPNSARVGEVDCFPNEPALAREIKLSKRSRFRGFEGEV
jgi:hypothetical protein